MKSIHYNDSKKGNQQVIDEIEQLVNDAFYHKNKVSTHGAMGCGYVLGLGFVISTLVPVASNGISEVTNDVATKSLVGMGILTSLYVFQQGLRRVRERNDKKEQIESAERQKVEELGRDGQYPFQKQARPRSLWEIQFDQAKDLMKQLEKLVLNEEIDSLNWKQRKKLRHVHRRARDVADLYQMEQTESLKPKQKAKLALDRVKEERLLSSSASDQELLKELELAIKVDEKIKLRERTYQARCEDAGRQIRKFKFTQKKDAELAQKRTRYAQALTVVDQEVKKFRETALKGQMVFRDLHNELGGILTSLKSRDTKGRRKDLEMVPEK